MSDQTLNKYIKQNLAAGFRESDVRQALVDAGWPAAEISESFKTVQQQSPPLQNKPRNPNGFWPRHKRALIFVLVILIASPLLVYLSFWAYQKLSFAPSHEQAENPSLETPVAAAEAKQRDYTRLSDIQKLQAALENYSNAQGAYPKTLAGLGEPVPLDPKSKKPYVYSAFGDPVLYYSLSFALETEIGPLKNGLQVVTADSPLAVTGIQKQEEAVSGLVAQKISEGLKITDLTIAPFKPQEEVAVAVDSQTSEEIENVFLVVDKLKLIDRTMPFGFKFSAPKNAGAYTVQIFAVDKSGNVLYQEMPLTVAAP